MLINDFYTCRDTEVQESDFSCTLVFNEAHDIFGGHFPGQPVVPGVCMMEIVKELLQEQVKEQLILRSTGNVKFLQLIKPEMQPVVKFNWKKSDTGYNVNATFSSEGAAVFKLAGYYELMVEQG